MVVAGFSAKPRRFYAPLPHGRDRRGFSLCACGHRGASLIPGLSAGSPGACVIPALHVSLPRSRSAPSQGSKALADDSFGIDRFGHFAARARRVALTSVRHGPCALGKQVCTATAHGIAPARGTTGRGTARCGLIVARLQHRAGFRTGTTVSNTLAIALPRALHLS